MPLRVDMVDVPEDALVHHVLHHLVEVAVAPLQAGLQDLFGMFPRQRAQRVHFVRLEHQALFAEDVFARQQGIASEREVHEQRRDHKHRVDILLRQQIAVVFVRFRIAADGLDAMVEGFRQDVAQRHAAAAVDLLQVFQQVGPAAAATDHAVLHLFVGGLHPLDERRSGGYGPGGFQYIAAGNVILLCHEKATSQWGIFSSDCSMGVSISLVAPAVLPPVGLSDLEHTGGKTAGATALRGAGL